MTLTDFRAAGFLVSRGHPLRATQLNEKQEVMFVFDDGATNTLVLYPGSVEQQYDVACQTMHHAVRALLGRKQHKK